MLTLGRKIVCHHGGKGGIQKGGSPDGGILPTVAGRRIKKTTTKERIISSGAGMGNPLLEIKTKKFQTITLRKKGI